MEPKRGKKKNQWSQGFRELFWTRLFCSTCAGICRHTVGERVGLGDPIDVSTDLGCPYSLPHSQGSHLNSLDLCFFLCKMEGLLCRVAMGMSDKVCAKGHCHPTRDARNSHRARDTAIILHLIPTAALTGGSKIMHPASPDGQCHHATIFHSPLPSGPLPLCKAGICKFTHSFVLLALTY